MHSDREAVRLLKGCNWDLNVALNVFYESRPQSDNRQHISVDGTMRLCEDLEIDPTQLEFLIISYYLGSERMGEFERDRFVQGCMKLQCDTLEKLRASIPFLKNNLHNHDNFRDLYCYAFLFGRQTGQKNMSLEAAIELWRLLLGDQYSMLGIWIQFLEENHGKAISRDTWNLFYEFISQPNLDLTKYDAEGAWPILIDEFVQYCLDKGVTGSTS
ncbi:Cullin binding-domain-containing protein [Radiomyces spectabilis]|uniref:Cullin binding-domain-containing protein n=1 Tax=Radiomyces spectabilis TaxID=64574 RepID=UPI00221E64AC|nr:Cullin binding-domain-containing protein [Radiomyces spectabilis]KAI8384835.1 Cullin binding-domain-containing protein [Radiomyces spectabilis]